MRSTDGLRRYWAGYRAADNDLYYYDLDHARSVYDYAPGHSQAYWDGYWARLRKATKAINREENDNE